MAKRKNLNIINRTGTNKTRWIIKFSNSKTWIIKTVNFTTFSYSNKFNQFIHHNTHRIRSIRSRIPRKEIIHIHQVSHCIWTNKVAYCQMVTTQVLKLIKMKLHFFLVMIRNLCWVMWRRITMSRRKIRTQRVKRRKKAKSKNRMLVKVMKWIIYLRIRLKK